VIIKYGYSFWCERTNDLIHMHPNSYPYFMMPINTRIQMFYFLNRLNFDHTLQLIKTERIEGCIQKRVKSA